MKSDLSAFTPEYGHAVGVATPQANTTVEPEMQLPLEGTVLTTRLTSTLADSHARLIDYFDRLSLAIGQFDVAPLKAVGFACTGSCPTWSGAMTRRGASTPPASLPAIRCCPPACASAPP